MAKKPNFKYIVENINDAWFVFSATGKLVDVFFTKNAATKFAKELNHA